MKILKKNIMPHFLTKLQLIIKIKLDITNEKQNNKIRLSVL